MSALTQKELHVNAPAASNGTDATDATVKPAAPAFTLADLMSATVTIDATEVQSAIAGIKAPRGGAHAVTPITDTLYYQLVAHYYTSGQWGVRGSEYTKTTKTTDHGTVAGTGMVVTRTEVDFTGKIAPYIQLPWNHPAVASLPELQPRKSATDTTDADADADATDSESESTDATDATDATTDGKKKREDRLHDRFYKRLREAGDAHEPRLYVAAVSNSELTRGIAAKKLAPDCATFRVFADSERPVMSDTMRAAREKSKEKRAAEKAASATRTVDGPVPPDAAPTPDTTDAPAS